MDEVIPFKQQWQAQVRRSCISDAVRKIQRGFVIAAPERAVGLSRPFGPVPIDRHNLRRKIVNHLIERIAPAARIGNNTRLKQRGRG